MVRDLGLAGKRVVVTGAAGGLGRAFAQAFGQAGATVLAGDINNAGLEETVALVAAAGGKGFCATVDVTDARSCRDLAQTARSAMGGADVLVNNAALYAGLQRGPFEELDEADELFSSTTAGGSHQWTPLSMAVSMPLHTAPIAMVAA